MNEFKLLMTDTLNSGEPRRFHRGRFWDKLNGGNIPRYSQGQPRLEENKLPDWDYDDSFPSEDWDYDSAE